MPFKDIREFIAKLEKEGEAQRIEGEVDWNLEVGAMIRRSNEEGLPRHFSKRSVAIPMATEYLVLPWAIANG